MSPLAKEPHTFYLTLLRLVVGAVFLVAGLGKWSWLDEPDVLTKMFNVWLGSVGSIEQGYIEFMMPAAEVLRYVVLFGELATAISLMLGVLVPVSSVLAALMVLNFKLASGGLLTWRFFGDPYGMLLVVLLVMFATMRAGRSFGFDSVLQRKLPSLLA